MLRQRFNGRTLSLVFVEGALITGALNAAAYVRLPEYMWLEAIATGFFVKSLLVAVATQICFYYSGLYELRVIVDRRDSLVRLVQGLGAAAVLLGFIYFLSPGWGIGRGVLAIAAPVIVVGAAGWRVGFEWMTRQLGPRERLLLIGTNSSAVTLARELHERQDLSVEIVGFIDPDPAKVGMPVLNPGVLGALDDIPRIATEHRVDRIVVSLTDARGQLPMDKLLELKLAGVSFDHLATVYEHYTGKIAVENLRPSWLIFSEGFRKSLFQTTIKRGLDVALSLIGLVLAAPLMLITAACVKLESRGPVLYRQRRLGQKGREFTILKFRSMRPNAEEDTGAVWAKRDDPRTTRFGHLIRKIRIDELPQLWNILRGDMSFVGPRPERPEFVRELTVEIPYYGQRHVVKPGLTGWAQVRYPYGASVADALQKLQYDLFYIKHMSLGFDIFIILKTVKTVLMRNGQ